MKTLITAIATAALALAAGTTLAQTKPTQTTGEMSPQQKVDEGVVKAQKPAPSTVDRKAAQQEAAAARKAGTSADGECAAEQKADVGACKKPAAAKSTTTRAEVKKDAIAAAKAGKTPGGEKP
jgi:hypothetical protein